MAVWHGFVSGLAKAGELNSYPGPLHVLQLADQLGLSETQRRSTDALYAKMREEAVSIGRQIIEAHSDGQRHAFARDDSLLIAQCRKRS